MITLDFDGQLIDLPEWSLLRSAKSTLVKLILVARLYNKLSPIWKSLPSVHKGSLKDQYWIAFTIMRCLTHCYENNLIEFQRGRENPLSYTTRFTVNIRQTGAESTMRLILPVRFLLGSSPVQLLIDYHSGSDVKKLNAMGIGENYRELCRLLVTCFISF